MRRILLVAMLAWWAVWVSEPPQPTRILIGPFDDEAVCVAFLAHIRFPLGWTTDKCKELIVTGDS
jgi:hypothetical protein